ncbi:DNA-binding GntR family transcriptional regulator [Rhodococcus sp. PvR044]|uniref:hypothetical protein n=1 Tax=Rhodococcus sp. PvR044 TaxID=3156402 RepID=UPI003392CA42
MSDTKYVEMDIRVRARVRVPEGQDLADIFESREVWESGVVSELQADLTGEDVKQYIEKAECDIEVLVDPDEWELS